VAKTGHFWYISVKITRFFFTFSTFLGAKRAPTYLLDLNYYNKYLIPGRHKSRKFEKVNVMILLKLPISQHRDVSTVDHAYLLFPRLPDSTVKTPILSQN